MGEKAENTKHTQYVSTRPVIISLAAQIREQETANQVVYFVLLLRMYSSSGTVNSRRLIERDYGRSSDLPLTSTGTAAAAPAETHAAAPFHYNKSCPFSNGNYVFETGQNAACQRG